MVVANSSISGEPQHYPDTLDELINIGQCGNEADNIDKLTPGSLHLQPIDNDTFKQLGAYVNDTTTNYQHSGQIPQSNNISYKIINLENEKYTIPPHWVPCSPEMPGNYNFNLSFPSNNCHAIGVSWLKYN